MERDQDETQSFYAFSLETEKRPRVSRVMNDEVMMRRPIVPRLRHILASRPRGARALIELVEALLMRQSYD